MKRYLPLIVLVALSALFPLAVGVDDGRGWLMDFMGYFLVNFAMIALMGFGAIGVFTALKKGLNIDCACMGTSLKVPLSTVAIVEDLGMVILAALLLIS
ncbi:hypothetical protein OAG59_00775 [Akkermansiaceae bacterium]|nr:hypothetical protein [bacterium]MDB4796215.1 hypothetical protein [Akkermansiaceae bacterium]MDC0274947.1 hypothetical protein [Akkermansiaceae bacterium]